MNGFVNTILTALLSWIRALISNLWTLLRSEDGGAFYRFLSAHWLTIVIILCVVCVIIDGIVYFFRWRPDLIWATNLRRIRRRKEQRRDRRRAPETYYEEPYENPYPYEQPVPETAYAPLQQPAPYAADEQPTQVWQNAQAYAQPEWEEEVLWETDEPVDLEWDVQPQEAPAQPIPDPITYYRDVQAGFAPAVPPEQLYAPSASYQPHVPETESEAEYATPVHPGLDDEAFRQNIGLQPSSPEYAAPVVRAPAFRPFTVTQPPRPEPAQQGAFHRFAQKARDFMAMDDDQKSIRDLQSSVDVSKAFHEPVYPQPFDHTEE